MSSARYDCPRAAVGNLRFTDTGVYADYLVSGLPFIFMAKDAQDRVADVHAELLRALPSGAMLSGLTTDVSTRNIARRMVFAHPDLHPAQIGSGAALPAHTRDWVAHCRTWESALRRRGSRRRIYWLSLPLDYGLSGATATGTWQRRLTSIVGADKDSAESLNRYRELAAGMVGALPPSLFAKPASAEQIWWHWNYTASRHVWRQPLPSTPYDPDARLPGSAFTPVWTDPSGAGARGRRWRAARSDAEVFLRTYRDPDDGIADSYQAFLGIESFPDTGVRWPQSTLFKMLDDLSTPSATVDWTIHVTFDSADVAVATAHNVILNIKDQARQIGRHAHSDDELVRKLASGKQLASALKRGAERGVNAAVLVAAAAPDPQTVDTAITEVVRRYRRQGLDLRRRRGSQQTWWRAFNPGTETSAALQEIRNPTTTAAFAKFVPLLATGLGNNTGVPLGETITSPGLREVVLLDLLNAPARDNPGNLVIGGSPGRGKSQCAKNLILSWLRMGAGVHLIDPTEAREHEHALSMFDDGRKIVIDARRPRFTLDGLRIFGFAEAAERTVDHLLPQMGFSPVSPQAARLKGLLAPESRHANGIGATNGLITLLRDRTRPDRVSVDDDLLVALEGLRAERLLAPMFDDTAPPPDLSRQLVIWNFGGLKLPTVTEEYQAHLHHQSTPSARAAQALYGMAAELAQSMFFARDTTPDVFVVEECAAWTHSPGGQRCANTLIRQGRKAWTQFVGISQAPRHDFGVLEDHFIEQRICLGFKESAIAEDTLRWCNRDLARHPKLLADYVTNTSPAQIMAYGDDTIDHRHGRVIPGREGEAWMLDEFGGWGKIRLFSAPTPELAELYDTNPYRRRMRTGTTP
ncbi:hypothetical protein Mycsm_06864 (plasmid) [Mycobacterium sp. JS623]|uniref:ATP-binding protein n=1 Tax=Mycobacterium sp. JS623 TaxID=212767 RepID=UPI0002A5AB09|nr:ATP-binding protein [Mycobacterium sp. JS623]AGB26968.1 hypothetical protein Mycsm_06864 [Mycobacterium sp. JS623]